jgi:hypothetical protein
MKKEISSLILITSMVFLLIGNVSVYATSDLSQDKTVAAKQSIVPDFIWDAIPVFNPNAGPAEIAKIRAMTIEQFTLNQKRIADTNGAILNPHSPPAQASSSRSFAYMSSYIRSEIVGQSASLLWPTNLIGQMDGQGALLFTPYPNSHVAVIGAMSSTTYGADVYVTAKLGATGAGKIGNYAVVWGCWFDDQTPPPDYLWVPIGFSQITTSDWGWYFIGSAGTWFAFNDVTVSVLTSMTPPGGPPGGLCQYNDILVDSVSAYPP